MIEPLSSSTAAFFRRSQTQMSDLQGQAERLQQQIATGERLERSSDDPAAAARLRDLARQERLADVDAGNSNLVTNELRDASANIGDIADALIRVRELTLQAGTDTIQEQGRIAIADEIDVLRESIFANINASSSAGRSLFGGETEGPAYTLDAAGNASYAGSANSSSLTIADGVSIERGVTGPDVLNFDNQGTPTDVLAFLQSLSGALRGGVADPGAFARDALPGVESAIDTTGRNQAVIGARLAWVDTVDTSQQLRGETRAIETAEVGGTDLASAISRLQQVLTVLEASQASFARLSSLTLFDRI